MSEEFCPCIVCAVERAVIESLRKNYPQAEDAKWAVIRAAARDFALIATALLEGKPVVVIATAEPSPSLPTTDDPVKH